MFGGERRKSTLELKPEEFRKQQRRKSAIDHQVRETLRLARKIPIEMNLVGVEPKRGILKQQRLIRHDIHTSGSSIVGTQSAGERVDAIFNEETPIIPSIGRAARVALNKYILSFKEKGVRSVIICPSLIYGIGHGPAKHSIQVPWLIALAKKGGVAKHYGPGENIWSNVHIDDLVDLYNLAITSAPAGAFYFAENGENSMKQVCEAINCKLGVNTDTVPMSLDEASREWGEGAAQNTMGSNSRVRAVRARAELGWRPSRPSLIDEIENGCYTECLVTQ